MMHQLARVERDDRGRRLLRAEPVVVARARDRAAQHVGVVVDRVPAFVSRARFGEREASGERRERAGSGV